MTLNEYFNKEQIELHPCGVEHLKKEKMTTLILLFLDTTLICPLQKPVLDFLFKKIQNFTEINGADEIGQITNKFNDILKV